jgi:Fe-S-cluster containining protein
MPPHRSIDSSIPAGFHKLATMNSNAPQRQPVSLDVIPTSGQAVTSCDGCGVCCTEQNIPPYLDEIDFIPVELQREVYEARKIEAALEGKPCIWQDPVTRKCIHHEHRPNICREYEVGGELCLEIRQRLGVK